MYIFLIFIPIFHANFCHVTDFWDFILFFNGFLDLHHALSLIFVNSTDDSSCWPKINLKVSKVPLECISHISNQYWVQRDLISYHTDWIPHYCGIWKSDHWYKNHCDQNKTLHCSCRSRFYFTTVWNSFIFVPNHLLRFAFL